MLVYDRIVSWSRNVDSKRLVDETRSRNRLCYFLPESFQIWFPGPSELVESIQFRLREIVVTLAPSWCFPFPHFLKLVQGEFSLTPPDLACVRHFKFTIGGVRLCPLRVESFWRNLCVVCLANLNIEIHCCHNCLTFICWLFGEQQVIPQCKLHLSSECLSTIVLRCARFHGWYAQSRIHARGTLDVADDTSA